MTHSLATQIHISRRGIDLSKPLIFDVKNRDYFCKPTGGMWSATFLGGARISSWYEWCRAEMTQMIYGDSVQPYLIHVNSDARVYEIDTYVDLVRLYKSYGKRDQFEGRLDFEKVSKDYDGIHLTDAGQWATRFAPDQSGHGINLYGWDMESTVFFREVFKLEQYAYPKLTLKRGKIKGRGR